jgi:hypothetical protein
MAIRFVAQICTAYCSCGGQYKDDSTYSYDITSDTTRMVCDECGTHMSMYGRKGKASLFA